MTTGCKHGVPYNRICMKCVHATWIKGERKRQQVPRRTKQVGKSIAKCLLLIAIFLSALLICWLTDASPLPRASEDEITRYIRWELRTVKKDKRWERAPVLAKHIVKESESAGVSPVTVAVTIFMESSFREGTNRKGSLGEVGLGQFHGKAAKRVDLKTTPGQIKGVAALLAKGYQECNSGLLGALSYYQAGRCHTQAAGPRIRAYKIKKVTRLLQKWRAEN